MHSSQVTLVQTTFDKVLPISDVAAQIFYDRLFQLDPSMRRLFNGDLRMQGKKLMDALSIIVGNLNRPDRIVPGIRALGRRHAAYGVQNHHYTTAGEALLWTLEHGLGDAFTAEVRRAWTGVQPPRGDHEGCGREAGAVRGKLTTKSSS
ncbi:MAG: globin family protein [Acidobacteriota bacterium]